MTTRESREEARRRLREAREAKSVITDPVINPPQTNYVDRILEWSSGRYAATRKDAPKLKNTKCMICKKKNIKPEGKGTYFLRNEDGSYVYRCGGEDGKGSLELRKHGDIVMKVPLLMDTHTLKQEIRPTQRETVRELKQIRDSVLARNVIDDEDRERFETLETMSRQLTKLEETYIQAIHSKPPELYTYIYEEEPVSELLKESQYNTRQIRGEDGKVLEKVKPLVFGVVYPEEIPVGLQR
jgi:hypothetical protein